MEDRDQDQNQNQNQGQRQRQKQEMRRGVDALDVGAIDAVSPQVPVQAQNLA